MPQIPGDHVIQNHGLQDWGSAQERSSQLPLVRSDYELTVDASHVTEPRIANVSAGR